MVICILRRRLHRHIPLFLLRCLGSPVPNGIRGRERGRQLGPIKKICVARYVEAERRKSYYEFGSRLKVPAKNGMVKVQNVDM